MNTQVTFTSETASELQRLQREIIGLKYLFLTIAESPSIRVADKLSFKKQVTHLAEDLHRHFQDLRYRKISRFNIKEVEHSERRSLRKLSQQLQSIVKIGKKILPVKVDLGAIPVSESELDSTLNQGRIAEQRTLEKGELDHLNSIRQFVSDQIEPQQVAERERAAKITKATSELMELKIRNYREKLVGCEARNPEILFRVRNKIENVLERHGRVHVLPGDIPEIERTWNHNELYVCNMGGDNFRFLYFAGNTSFNLRILLTDRTAEQGPSYRGEIRGVAEAGINEAAFSILDSQRKGPGQDREKATRFLKAAGFDEIYQQVKQLCAKNKAEQETYDQRVENEMKQKVAQALDQLL
jgi:predicted RNA-binding protein with EMAP domain